MRNIILGLGWPVLILGSILLIVKGQKVYKLVKGSLVGKISITLVFTMLIEMYSLAIVCTSYMFTNLEKSIYIVIPVFIAWGATFGVCMVVLNKAMKDTLKLTETPEKE
ncbi:MAG: hypothetical protein ABID45_03295 [Patescibacteria group bacterium]